MFKKSKQVGDNSIFGIIRSIAAKKDNDGIVIIAPGLAQQILDETNWQGQRRVKRGRVEERKSWIAKGSWDAQCSVISFAETPDGHIYLVDGQHRLTAIHEVARCVKTKMDILQAQDLNHVRRIYATFDLPDAGRGDMELLDAVGAASLLKVQRKIVAAAFKCLPVIRNDMEPLGNRGNLTEARSRSGRLDDLPKWAKEVRLFADIVDSADSYLQRKMLRQGCMAVALYTLRHAPSVAVEFWAGLAENDGLRKNDPRARLIADFNNRTLSNGSIRQGVQRIAVAWNAFCQGRELKIIKCVEGGDIRLSQTPLAKRAAA